MRAIDARHYSPPYHSLRIGQVSYVLIRWSSGHHLAIADNTPVHSAETTVVSHSASLHRELGIVGLALAQVLILIVPEFFGTAVKAGPSHIVLWIFAIVLFFIPHAFVVAHLNRLIPLKAVSTNGLGLVLVTGWGSLRPGMSGFCRQSRFLRSPW